MTNIIKTLVLSFVVPSLVLFLIPGTSVVAQRQAWDTSYIPDDTFFVGALNVESLLEHEPMDSRLRTALARVLKENGGIKLDDLRQVQFLMGGAPVNSDEDTFEMKFLFSEDQDFAPMMEKMFRGDHEEAEFDGKTYYRNDRERMPSFYMPDKQTFVLANEVRLKKLMSSGRSKGKIFDQLSNLEGDSDAVALVVGNDQFNENIDDLFRVMDDLPFDLREIVAGIDEGSVVVKLDSDQPVRISLKAENKDSAERLKRAADALIALGKIGVDNARKMVENSPVKESATKGLDSANSILEGATTKLDGNTLMIETKVMGGAVEGARALAELAVSGIDREASFEEEAVEVLPE